MRILSFLLVLFLSCAVVFLGACNVDDDNGGDDDDNNDDDNNDDAADDDDNDSSSDDDDDNNDNDFTPPFGSTVTVADPPSGNPLSRKIILQTEQACSLTGYVTNADEPGYGPTTPESTTTRTNHIFWFHGLLEDRRFQYTFFVTGQPDQIVAKGHFDTPLLPDLNMVLEELVFLPSPPNADWIAVNIDDKRSMAPERLDITAIVDRQGRYRFFHQHEIGGGWIEPLPSGEIAFHNYNNIYGLRLDGSEYTLIELHTNEPYLRRIHHQMYIDDLAETGQVYFLYNEYGPGLECDLVTPTDFGVGDGVIEIDAAGEELWRWSSFDHHDDIPPAAMEPDNCLTYMWGEGTTDLTHANSVSPVPGEDAVIVSMRNAFRVVKIDTITGDVIWQMGPYMGVQWLDFEYIGADPPEDAWFRISHDAKFIAPNRILLFDNGACRYEDGCTSGPWSRALEMEIDETEMTVRTVWEHRLTMALAQGNVTRHADGNTLIGGGSRQWVIEAMPDGTETFRMKYEHGIWIAKYYPALWRDQ